MTFKATEKPSSSDRESFRQWLEQQEGPLVGTGRTNMLRVGRGAYKRGLDRHDDTSLARYLTGVLGYPVFIAGARLLT